MTKKTTREERAAALIESGAVQLFPGRGYALVQGKTGRYSVTKNSCDCRDHLGRGGDCYHRIATRKVCQLYRDCQAEAKATGRVKLTADLYLALVDCSTRRAAS